MIIKWALDLALVMVGLAMLIGIWRLVRGPDACDRVLAIDTLYINVAALAVLIGIRQSTDLMFDVAMVIALLGFVSTVALARYLTRGDVVG